MTEPSDKQLEMMLANLEELTADDGQTRLFGKETVAGLLPLAREGLASRKAGGWLPIESVPEAEHVLLYFPKGERGVGGMECGTIVRQDDGSLPNCAWTHGGPNAGYDWGFDDDSPTHWHKTPDPPRLPDAGGAEG